MIISHRHKFIFLHVGKTAGTSLHIALSKFCGPDDVVTNISRHDRKYLEEFGGNVPQNNIDVCGKELQGHASAEYVKKIVSPDIWDSYFKFCFERNPWDKTISLFCYLQKMGKLPKHFSISKFVNVYRNKLVKLKSRGYGIYTIKDEIVLDKIFLYEHFDVSIAALQEILHLPLVLPKAKGNFRAKEMRDPRSVLSEEDINIISKIFKEEIELFGYTI